MASGGPPHSWQPAAPTAGGKQQQQQQPGQQQQMPPMAYHPQQGMGGRGGGGGGRGHPQQQQQQGGRGQGPHAYVVGMPPPQMGYAPAGYHNPYAQHQQQQQQYNPQQVAGGRGGGGTHGWNPTYPGGAAPVPVGGNPYAQGYYPQQGGGAGRGPGNNAAGRGGGVGGRGTPSYTPPAPRVKKALVITDKDGNPIDFSAPKKKSATEAATKSPATVEAKAAVATEKPSNAGANLRQAALDAIQGKADKESVKKKAEEEAAAKKAKEEAEAATAAAAKKKEVEEQAAATKKAEEKAAADAAAAAKKKEEAAAAVAAKFKKAEAATAAPKAKSSLSSLLTKLVVKEEEVAKQEEVVKEESPKTSPAEPEKDTETASPSAAAPTTATPSTNGKKRRHVYSKEELLRLRSLPVCQERPADLGEFVIVKGASAVRGGPGGGGGGDRGGGDNRGGGGDRRQQNRGGGGGGGGSWERGAAPPQQQQAQQQQQQGQRRGSQQTNQNDGGGGQWARGKAPPPQQQQQHGGGRGGRGGGRGGRGGRGGQQGPPFFDGPVAPLSKSANGWRPTKNNAPMAIAEKKVKSILNKMTKEKFDRLSQQIIDIPVKSYQILTMMIANVYEKAIDEPYLGDMYGDLCVRLSQHVQSNSFVQVIESDEEPPTEDGEPAPPSTGGDAASNFSVFRWSHDVSTDDSDIVGPFTTVEDCMEMALSSDEQQDPVERGDMELELVKLQIKNGVFVKVMKKMKKTKANDDEEKEEGEEEDDDELKDEFFTVFFPVSDHEECGQQLSKIFLSDRECISDANKQNSFKRSLLNKCEDEFNKQDIYVDFKKEKVAYEESKGSMSAKEQKEKEDDMNFRRMKIKKQMLGNVKFIGQLYKKSLLKEKIMRFCIASLLNLETKDVRSKLPVYYDAGDGEMDEEDHEAICNMFATIGKTIDKPATLGFMKVCFDKIKKLSFNDSLPARSRFMYKDLLDLRSNYWVPRRKEEKAKTLEEIRRDVEEEERQQAQEAAAMHQGGGNYRGNNNYGGRGGGGRGGSGDYRSNNNNNRGGNYGNNNSSSSNRPRPVKQVTKTDDDGFTTIVGGAKPIGGSSLAQASQQPQRILKSKPGKTFPPLDKDKFARRVKSIRSEYMQDPKNLKELILSVDELTGTDDYGSQFVSQNADTMIDCKEDERKAIYLLLEILVKEGKISSSDVKAGLVDAIEFIDSFVCDAPMAFDYLGRMLATMIRCGSIDVAWIGEQAEKTKEAGAANPEKIIRAIIKAIKADKGIDAVKNAFGPQQMAMETLLGKDQWVLIKAEMTS